MRHAVTRTCVSLLTASAVALACVAPPLRAQVAAPSPVSTPGHAACEGQDEAAFRRAVGAITVSAMERGIAGLDLKGLVSEEWRRGRIDEIVTREVDAAVVAVREETSFGRLMESIVNSETARQIATPVAERVYRSDAMKAAMEQMANSIGREIGRRIEIAAVDAGRPAAACIEAFLGPRYGTTVARIVASEALQAFGIDPAKAAANVTPGAIVAEGSGVIAGVVIVIVRRELATLANQILQRLVGVALGRMASTVIGGVGLVLIAKDVWDFRHGVMPIIADEMKSPATREKVQEELAKVIGEQIGERVRDIGGRTAERVVDIWRDFQRTHLKILELSDASPAFKRLLDSVRPERMRRLNETVGLILADSGGRSIEARLADGTLQTAVETLDEPAFQIARDRGSIDDAIKWAALAGPLLPRVVEDELHRRSPPEVFTRAALVRLLGLGDRLTAGRLAALEPVARDTLLELGDGDLRAVTRGLGDGELRALAGYLGPLDKALARRLVETLVTRPAAMQLLAPDSVREALLRSRDPAAALDMLLRPDGAFELSRVMADFDLLRQGRVEPRLILARHPLPLAMVAISGLLLLTLLWRALFGRRRPIAARVINS